MIFDYCFTPEIWVFPFSTLGLIIHPPITAGFQARAVGKNADTWPVSDLVRLLLAVAKAKKVRFRYLFLLLQVAASWSEGCYPPEN